MSGNGHGVLEELVHVTGAARMSGRQDDASSLLAKIGLSCIDGITNTLMNYFQVRIELNMKQLDDSFWMIWSGMKSIGIISPLADIGRAHFTIGSRVGRDVGVPALLAMREHENVVQWGVHGVEMTDALETATLSWGLETQDDLSVFIYVFITTSRYNSSDLINSREVIMVWII